eukprot:gnl/Dysnectes_brevis/5694_a8335_329.p1 GENE.gnl/Dysnectes_brevis/5694_a8335_329~~gnl/Dysnectes_brevis/5694_a8335_329.p1  ORF type:complete len:602 (+),score=89.50 gnl/Dysnectes_brevis/5694_a8335_329:1760-3565(+)
MFVSEHRLPQILGTLPPLVSRVPNPSVYTIGRVSRLNAAPLSGATSHLISTSMHRFPLTVCLWSNPFKTSDDPHSSRTRSFLRELHSTACRTRQRISVVVGGEARDVPAIQAIASSVLSELHPDGAGLFLSIVTHTCSRRLPRVIPHLHRRDVVQPLMALGEAFGLRRTFESMMSEMQCKPPIDRSLLPFLLTIAYHGDTRHAVDTQHMGMWVSTQCAPILKTLLDTRRDDPVVLVWFALMALSPICTQELRSSHLSWLLSALLKEEGLQWMAPLSLSSNKRTVVGVDVPRLFANEMHRASVLRDLFLTPLPTHKSFGSTPAKRQERWDAVLRSIFNAAVTATGCRRPGHWGERRSAGLACLFTGEAPREVVRNILMSNQTRVTLDRPLALSKSLKDLKYSHDSLSVLSGRLGNAMLDSSGNSTEYRLELSSHTLGVVLDVLSNERGLDAIDGCVDVTALVNDTLKCVGLLMLSPLPSGTHFSRVYLLMDQVNKQDRLPDGWRELKEAAKMLTSTACAMSALSYMYDKCAGVLPFEDSILGRLFRNKKELDEYVQKHRTDARVSLNVHPGFPSNQIDFITNLLETNTTPIEQEEESDPFSE